MITDRKYQRIEITAGLIILLFGLLFYAVWYSYHLFFTEQMQLFLLTPEYFLTYLAKPGVIAQYLGDFLTGFYYLRGGGAIVITGNVFVLWLFVRLLSKLFSPEKPVLILSLAPVIAVLALHGNIFYSLSSTLAIILAMASLLLLFMVRRIIVRRLLGIVLLPLVYWAIGGTIILYAVLFVLHEILVSSQRKLSTWIWASLILLTGLLVPMLLKRIFLLTMEQAYLFPSARLAETQGWLIVPSAVIILVVLGQYFIRHRSAFFLPFSELVLLLAFGTFAFYKNTDFNLEKVLSIDSELYFNHLDKAQQLAKKHQLKSSVGAYFYNLINSKMDCMPERLMDGFQTGTRGLFLPVDFQQNYITITFSNEVYYYLGDVNASQHTALLGMIFSPKSESSRLMRRLVQINIINGEYAVAGKYIKMLKKSMFHRKWAQSLESYLFNEERCTQTPWIMVKRKLRPISEDLKTTNDHEKTLQLLLETNPKNKHAFDYLNCYYLFQKDIEKFAKLCMGQNEVQLRQLPEIYQKAMLIYYMQNPAEEIRQNLYIKASVVNNFKAYIDAFEQYKGDGKVLQNKFGKTYWFYYHYAIPKNY